MDYIKCPSCGCVLERKNGPYGEFAGCSNYPRCNYSANISSFSNEDKKKINYSTSQGYYGECMRCGQKRTLNTMGHCEACAEWFEHQ